MMWTDRDQIVRIIKKVSDNFTVYRIIYIMFPGIWDRTRDEKF